VAPIHQHNDIIRREALHIWKRKNGSGATYSKLVEIFERAGHKDYADEVRRIIQPPSNSKTYDSSEEHSQPQTYPVSEPQSLSQVPPAMHSDKSTEVHYVMTPPEGKFTNYIIRHYTYSKTYNY
jgi:hypothetical protein